MQRWARKLTYPLPKPTPVEQLRARWPGFGCAELRRYISAHGGNAKAAGDRIAAASATAGTELNGIEAKTEIESI